MPRKTLKICLISTAFFNFPPKRYSGLELIVWNLACGLTKLGHKVVVFAPEGKNPPSGFLYECGEPLTAVNVDWLEAEKNMWKIYDPLLDDFDICHSHDWFSFLYASKARNPDLKCCHTHHGGLNLEWWKRSRAPFKLNLIAISKWMSEVYKSQGFESRYVYNGIAIENYAFSKEERNNRILFVGRIDKFKQPHLVVEVAKKLGLGADIVGGTFVQDPSYLEQIRNMCDGTQIKFWPDASHEKKIKLMQSAKCLLFVSSMGEPFGLVPVEMMATGGAVIALNDGAVEEVVGDAGIVCDVFDKKISPQGINYSLTREPVDALVEAVKRVDEIKPEACRARAKKYFSKEVMAKNYLNLYTKILDMKEW